VASGGRLTSVIDFFNIKADGRRIARQPVGNVMATLKGTDPTDDRSNDYKRPFRSHVSDVMDAKSDAPANDDVPSGSYDGTGRIMSKENFPYLNFCSCCW
jgi:hypothetical protein